MSRKKVIVIFAILLVILGIIFALNSSKSEITHNFSNIDVSSYDKLMIVAHPDDEMLWGGSHLLDEDYLVVRIPCGVEGYRVKEIKRVLK